MIPAMNDQADSVPALWLHCQPESETQIPITRLSDTSKIGRHPDCDVSIPSQYVSRFHAEIFFENGSWWIQDLDSQNGIFIDGKKTQRGQLPHQSLLQLGRQISFKIFIDHIGQKRS